MRGAPDVERSGPGTAVGRRIGIDYWVGATHAPGLGRYVRELVRALVALADGPPLALFDIGPGRRLPAPALGLAGAAPGRVVRRSASLPRRLFGRGAARLGLGADRWLGGVALFHRAFPDLPRVSAAPEVLPVAELPAPGSADVTALAAALVRARHVIAFSAAARAALIERFGVEPERVSALPVGCDHWLRDAAPLALATRPARQVVIALGALLPDRAPLAIAAAIERLVARGRDVELQFLGRPGALAARLAASPAARRLGPRLVVREPLESELPASVAAADVVCHLNADEWTPVTPLEAAAAGAVAVLSRLPAFEEVFAGPQAFAGAAYWVPRHRSAAEPDAEALEHALRDALDAARDPERHARARALAAPYTWQRHARLTAALWERILSP